MYVRTCLLRKFQNRSELSDRQRDQTNLKLIMKNFNQKSVRYGTVHHTTARHSIVQYSTVRYGTPHDSTTQYSTIQYSIEQHTNPKYRICIVMLHVHS